MQQELFCWLPEFNFNVKQAPHSNDRLYHAVLMYIFIHASHLRGVQLGSGNCAHDCKSVSVLYSTCEYHITLYPVMLPMNLTRT